MTLWWSPILPTAAMKVTPSVFRGQASGACVFNSDSQGYSADFGNQPGYDTVASPGQMDGMSFQANMGFSALTR